MKNKLFLLIATSLLLVGCNAKKQSSIDDDTSKDSGNDPVLPTGIETKTFTFINNKDVFPTGDLTKSSSLEKFVNGFNKDGDYVASVNISGAMQMLNMNNDVCYIKSILQFGSQNSEGAITINFNVDVFDVKVEAQACWKSYNPGTGVTTNVDTNAHLYVDKDEQDIDLSAEAGQEPAKHERSFEVANKKVKFYTKVSGQRAYIHSLTIKYRL